MSKPAAASTEPTTPTKVPRVKTPPNDLQKEFFKHAGRLANLKHIDAKTLGTDYLFPMLDLLARVAGEHDQRIAEYDEQLAELHESVEEIAGGDADLLELARDIILKLAAALDESVVLGGFFAVGAKGLTDTGKLDELGTDGKVFRKKYLELGSEVTEAVTEIQAAIEEDDGDDGDDGDEDDVEDTSEAAEAIQAAVAAPAQVAAPVPAPVVAPVASLLVADAALVAVSPVGLTPDAVLAPSKDAKEEGPHAA